MTFQSLNTFFIEIKLQVHGFAHVSFKQFDSRYYDTLDYINTTSNLIEPKPGEDQLSLGPGTHTFDFQFEVPSNCPSSYESWDGQVRYLIKVIIVRPRIFNQTRNVGFTVINSLNLNSCNPDMTVSALYFLMKLVYSTSFYSSFQFNAMRKNRCGWGYLKRIM